MDKETEFRLNHLRRQGNMPVPPKGGMFMAKVMDEKLIKEHRYDMSNVCPVCRVVKSKRGECLC